MTKQQADKWVLFLRSYGPVAKNGSMYAEDIPELSRQYGVAELRFRHPAEDVFLNAVNPELPSLTNVVLTGTAGDGKTTLCYALWQRLGGKVAEVWRKPYGTLTVETPAGPQTVHFLFDLSGWAPEKGQPWSAHQLDLLDRFASSVNGTGKELFVIAANDGKLIQIWRNLAELHPESSAAKLRPDLDRMLAQNLGSVDGKQLLLINLSGTSTAELLHLALSSLLQRPEWACFETLTDDPAYGSASPLKRNWLLLKDPLFSSRICTLMELCDANGLHVPVREIYLLLVNVLLGHPAVNQHVMRAADLRRVVADGTASLAAAHRNCFGDNLPRQKRDEYRVFGYLAMFRVGEETSNDIDNLLLFGRDNPDLHPEFVRLVESDVHYTPNAAFERLRLDYLGAEEFGEDHRTRFLAELSNERRRLFFRLPDQDGAHITPWQLTVFQSAGTFRHHVLDQLRSGKVVALHVVEGIVRGLNRAWSGMLIDDGTHLHLTSGLDSTTARLSPVSLHRVPVACNYYGEQITVEMGLRDRPQLVVHLLGQSVEYEMTLLRFEFLERISNGSLPNSFSRECYEDVIAFKSRLLAAWQRTQKSDPPQLRIVELDDHGMPREHTINL
jgi:hypothetical protein